MLDAYPSRLRIDGELYVLAQPRKSTPKPGGTAPKTPGSKTNKPKRRPSHRRNVPQTAAPAKPKPPGGQFDLSKLRIPRHPEVQRAWQQFTEKNTFRAKGKNKEIGWDTLRNADPQTAFELKRKFVDAWQKKLQQRGELPGAPAPAPAKVAPAEEPPQELTDEDLEEVKDEDRPQIETRNKPVKTRTGPPPVPEEKKPEEKKPEEKKPEEKKPEEKKPEEKKPEEKPADLSQHADSELDDLAKESKKKITELSKARDKAVKPPDWQSDIVKNLQQCANDPSSSQCETARQGLDSIKQQQAKDLKHYDDEIGKHRDTLKQVEDEQKRRKSPKPAAPAAEPEADETEEEESAAPAAGREVEWTDDDVREARELAKAVKPEEVDADEQPHAKTLGFALGKLDRYHDKHLAIFHKLLHQRQATSKKDVTKAVAGLKKQLKATTDPTEREKLQQNIETTKAAGKKQQAAHEFYLKKLSTEMGKRGLQVPTQYEAEPDEDEETVTPGDEDEVEEYGYGDRDEPGAREHTAPVVQVMRKETWQERRERRKEEKAKAKAAPEKAPEPGERTAPREPLTPPPSPTAPPPDQQAAHEHLRDQGVSEEVAKHVSELLSEPHDPQKLHQAMSKAVDKAVSALNDPNAKADVLATKGSVAHVLAKKFGAGAKKAGAVLRSFKKSAGGFFSALWGGIKKLFGAIGKGIKWLFSRIGRAAQRFGSTITGIEARRQARLNQATRHLHTRTPPHTAPVAASVYFKGVPYVLTQGAGS